MSEADIAEARKRIASAPRDLDLSGLDLSSRFDELLLEIAQLPELRTLRVQRVGLTTIGSELGQLQGLRELFLHGNRLTALPEELGQLHTLQWLVLASNRLTALPKGIGQLHDLQALFLNGNQLVDLPKEVGQLHDLKWLFLQRNQLTALPREIGQLRELQRLNLNGNQLTALPTELGQLLALQELYLHDNQLGIPTEVLGPDSYEEEPASPASILDYYFKLKSGTRPLNEAKLILLGRGAVGKTSLVNRLVRGQFDKDQKKTDGIRITQWPVQLQDVGQTDVTLNIWDFGGQEIMHATHQFFLTERSLYLVVISGRDGREDAEAEYWLRLLESFAGDSPVVVVLNKVVDHDFDLDRRGLLKKFPSVRAFVRTDCAEPVGLDELHAEILRQTDRLDGLRAKFPESWFAIKEKLAALRDEETQYLAFEEYQTICFELGEKEEKAQEELAGHLHNLGIALNYKEDPRLRETHVLSPHWVTTGIYKILNAQDVGHAKGELQIGELGSVLDRKEYPRKLHAFLVDLMRKFELCFPFHDQSGRYLIPELLGKEGPAAIEEFDPKTCLNFEYHYPILPEGLIPRFIVRTHVLSRQTPRWRTGVVLEFEGSRALITADGENRKVVIRIDGSTDAVQRLLSVIRADFEHIHKSFKFVARPMVPVPGHPDHYLKYEDLRARAERGKYEFDMVIDDDIIDLDVRDLLRLVDIAPIERSRRDSEHHGGVRLFYSYAHKDEALRDELDTHLKILVRSGVIAPWHDRQIRAGEKWGEKIDDNLERADIILLLVSADFVASDYSWNKEMARALERHATGAARVVPVIIRDVNWSNAPFAQLQALPKDAKPVDTWDNRDSAWRDVSEGIEKVASEIAAMRG